MIDHGKFDNKIEDDFTFDVVFLIICLFVGSEDIYQVVFFLIFNYVKI